MLYGRFLTDEDESATNYVAVIGYDLAEEIFGSAMYAYGDYLEIEDKNYEIVGVLEQMGSVSSGISPDSAVYIPYSTAEKYVFQGPRWSRPSPPLPRTWRTLNSAWRTSRRC